MATLKITANTTYSMLWDAITSHKYRVIVLKGGSRSGKTWAIIQVLITLSYQKARRITVWRSRRTWTKATVYKDFESYLKNTNIYSKRDHNQSDLHYRLNRSVFEFGGLDDAQKLHGLTSDISWLNEGIEATKDDFDQLEMRTNEIIIIDCNPTEEESWVYDLESRSDVLVLHSTFLDNAFLEEAIRRKILGYEPTEFNIKQKTADPYKWSVYGLGVAARKEGLIFPKWEIIPDFPEDATVLGFGLDFGFFPDPAAFGKVGLYNGRLVLHEMMYENELNNIIIPERPEIPSIQSRLNENGISRRDSIIADSAAKGNIKELKTVGFNIEPVLKYPGSVIDGIELMKNYEPFYVTESSVNAIKELKNYTYIKNLATGKFLKDPIDDFNHLMDLFRYVVQMKLNKPRFKKPRARNIKLS